MLLERGENHSSNTDDWANRCRYWSAKIDSTPTRKRRERQVEPLVLTGHGLSVRVDKSCLLVKGGNTHYPAKAKELRFFRGSLDIPPRIIAVDGAGSLSLDALDWMAEQGVTFVRINYDGSHSTVMSPSGYAGNNEKIRWQLETRDIAKRQLAFAVETTLKKFQAALEILRNCVPKSENQLAAIAITEKAISQLSKARSLSELLGIEGPTAKAYWRAWAGIEMRWKAQGRFPVPEEWRKYTSRISQNDKKWRNRNATHPVNAMLNYAYAVLLTEMRIKAISDGFDPTVGLLHDQREKKKVTAPSFALDLMEPLRPVVDRVVLELVAHETFVGSDFQLQSDGVCRLNPDLARHVASLTSRRLHTEAQRG